jgi:hypothetical protein
MSSVMMDRDEDLSWATTVRALARRAHRVRRSGAGRPRAADPAEARALLQQIVQFRRQLTGRRANDLRTWLDNLQREVEALVPKETQPPCPPRESSPLVR